jgi:hypothetical protein
MTVVRLPEGLMLHSPVPLSDEVAGQIDDLGPVRYIVAPNLFHHLHATTATARWPEASLHGPRALRRKRRDLRNLVPFEEAEPWSHTLQTQRIAGCLLGETLFFDARHGTLVSSDLVENFQRCDHTPTRLYLRASGLYKQVTWGRLLRPMYYDRSSAREGVDAVLAWPFERVVLAHGDCIVEDAHARVHAGMSWL